MCLDFLLVAKSVEGASSVCPVVEEYYHLDQTCFLSLGRGRAPSHSAAQRASEGESESSRAQRDLATVHLESHLYSLWSAILLKPVASAFC